MNMPAWKKKEISIIIGIFVIMSVFTVGAVAPKIYYHEIKYQVYPIVFNYKTLTLNATGNTVGFRNMTGAFMLRTVDRPLVILVNLNSTESKKAFDLYQVNFTVRGGLREVVSRASVGLEKLSDQVTLPRANTQYTVDMVVRYKTKTFGGVVNWVDKLVFTATEM